MPPISSIANTITSAVDLSKKVYERLTSLADRQDIKDAAVGERDAAIKEEAIKAVAEKNLEEIRKQAAE